MFRPAARFLIAPRPPDFLAARFFAAVILPPLLFFAILKSPPSKTIPAPYVRADEGWMTVHFGIALAGRGRCRAKNCVMYTREQTHVFVKSKIQFGSLSG